MPRFKAKSSTKKPPTSEAPTNKTTKTAAKPGSPKGKARAGSKGRPAGGSDGYSKEKQSRIAANRPTHPRDEAGSPLQFYSDIVAQDAQAAWHLSGDLSSLPHPSSRARSGLVARADRFDPTQPLMPLSHSFSSSSTSSPTSTKVANPTASIRHNTPLILCIVIGAVVVTATLSVGLAWILRLACCSSERKARRKRRLDRSSWSTSALTAAKRGKEQEEKMRRHKSLDSVVVTGGDDDLEDKDAKIDAFLEETLNFDGQVGGSVPQLPYSDADKTQEPPKSTWNGKGWTLFDPPVASVQRPEPVATAGGGNYGAARQELADHDVEGFTWPSSIQRQPSFIERLVQRHHQAAELPTTAPLPYPFEAKPPQSASRMASLGGAANRAMLNILPLTLRDAAHTASRQRATRKRYNDIQPYLDSDFEGTIGGKDRELPMARRLQRTEQRMAFDWTTEEEPMSPPENAPKQAGQSDNHLQHPIVQPVMVPSPSIPVDGKAPIEFTPGLAGVGAAWSRRGSQQSSLIGPHVPIVVRSSLPTAQLPKVLEPIRASVLPFPAMEGDRRNRLLGSVGRWLGQVTEAGETADPYTALSPRPDRRLTKNGSLRSDYTSTTLADSAATSSSTQVEARMSTNVSGKAERLLQRVDADQLEHDRQQRRLLRKARMFTPAIDSVAQQDERRKRANGVVDGNNVSRAPSIRPQFCATTDLKSWLEPGKVSTTHGLKVLEEQDAPSSVAADPFTSDAEAKPRLKKCESYDSFVSEARPVKTKLRSSSSKQRLRSATVVANARASAKDASRQKREALRPLNASSAKKASSNDMPISASHSSAAITVASSIFDEAFAAQLRMAANRKRAGKRAESKHRQPASRPEDDDEAKAKAKAEADAAVRDAWRRRKLLSISSRGSQRSRTARSTRTQSQQTGALLSRDESLRSQPSVYSELTAPSDYKFQAPLLFESTRGTTLSSCSASTADPISENLQEPEEVLSPEAMVARIREEEVQLKKRLKKEAKKAAKRQQRRAERQRANEDAAAENRSAADKAKFEDAAALAVPTREVAADPALLNSKRTQARAVSTASAVTASQPSMPISKVADSGADELARQLEVRRTIRKQRSISLGVARTQFAISAASVDDTTVLDSPWTSSDSDISIRRWGEPRRDDSFRLQNRGRGSLNSSSKRSEIAPVDVASRNKREASKHARAHSYYFGMGAGGDLRDFC